MASFRRNISKRKGCRIINKQPNINSICFLCFSLQKKACKHQQNFDVLWCILFLAFYKVWSMFDYYLVEINWLKRFENEFLNNEFRWWIVINEFNEFRGNISKRKLLYLHDNYFATKHKTQKLSLFSLNIRASCLINRSILNVYILHLALNHNL